MWQAPRIAKLKKQEKNDLFLLVSNSGKTREILELVELSRTLDPTLKFIVLTGNTDSPLAGQADVVLGTGNPQEVCALGLAPTTSTTVMNVIGDALVVETMKKIGGFFGKIKSEFIGKKGSNQMTNDEKIKVNNDSRNLFKLLDKHCVLCGNFVVDSVQCPLNDNGTQEPNFDL